MKKFAHFAGFLQKPTQTGDFNPLFSLLSGMSGRLSSLPKEQIADNKRGNSKNDPDSAAEKRADTDKRQALIDALDAEVKDCPDTTGAQIKKERRAPDSSDYYAPPQYYLPR